MILHLFVPLLLFGELCVTRFNLVVAVKPFVYSRAINRDAVGWDIPINIGHLKGSQWLSQWLSLRGGDSTENNLSKAANFTRDFGSDTKRRSLSGLSSRSTANKRAQPLSGQAQGREVAKSGATPQAKGLPAKGLPAALRWKSVSDRFKLKNKRQGKIRAGQVSKNLYRDESTEKAGALIKRKCASPLTEWYANIPPVTRAYLTLALTLTTAHAALNGKLPIESWMALHKDRTLRAFEFWRPLTASAFFGPLSLSMLNNMYFFANYGSVRERHHGSSEQLMFMLSQMILLSIGACAMKKPFYSSALSAAVVYACSQIDPHGKVPVVFGLSVESRFLPIALMGIAVLHAQKLNASYPYLLGMTTAQLYYLLTEVLPRKGGPNLLAPPVWLKRKLDASEVQSEVKSM
eukprot:GHVN01104256.1.p1 GENE.GHVN01104256.1~~GHVN01104256.1.p1  ORF type:complete len:405 (+),score=32.86 GHVN01104256.1:258-1472(+)